MNKLTTFTTSELYRKRAITITKRPVTNITPSSLTVSQRTQPSMHFNRSIANIYAQNLRFREPFTSTDRFLPPHNTIQLAARPYNNVINKRYRPFFSLY